MCQGRDIHWITSRASTSAASATVISRRIPIQQLAHQQIATDGKERNELKDVDDGGPFKTPLGKERDLMENHPGGCHCNHRNRNEENPEGGGLAGLVQCPVFLPCPSPLTGRLLCTVAVRCQPVPFRRIPKKEPAQGNHHPDRQRGKADPRTPPAPIADQRFPQPGVDEQAQGEALPGDAHGKTPAADEPLGNHIIAGDLQGAKAEEAYAQQSDKKGDRPPHIHHPQTGQPQPQTDHYHQAAGTEAIHQPSRAGQKESRAQTGRPVEKGDCRAGEVQVRHPQVEKEADGKALAGTHQQQAQGARGQHHPAVEEGCGVDDPAGAGFAGWVHTIPDRKIGR